MAINSKVCKDVPNKSLGFPKLGRRVQDGLVVLFSERGVGVVVGGAVPGGLPVGDFFDNWYMPHFTDFEGSVTLSNE